MKMNKSVVDAWMDTAGRYPLLCETDTLRLARKAQNLNIPERQRLRAIDRLCLHNLRLVVSTVRRYVDKTAHLTMRSDCVADLFQQGYLGLRRAVEKFDTKKKIRFATYATIWINQSVNRYKNATAGAIRVPEKAMYDVYHWLQNGTQRTGGREVLSKESQTRALMAMFPKSLDVKVRLDSEMNLADTISQENSLWQPSQDNSKEMKRVVELLEEAGIETKVRDMFLAYMRKGNLQMAAARARIGQSRARGLINDTVEKLRALA